MAFVDEMLDAEDLSDFVQSNHIISAVSAETIDSLKPRVPVSLSVNSTINDAISAMQTKCIGAVLVLEGQKLVGIFTERDVLFKVINKPLDIHQTTLREVMTHEPETLTEADRIVYALNRMTVGGYRHIPIVDAHDNLTGIISVKDIVEYLVSLVEEEVYNIRPEPLRAGGFSQTDGG